MTAYHLISAVALIFLSFFSHLASIPVMGNWPPKYRAGTIVSMSHKVSACWVAFVRMVYCSRTACSCESDRMHLCPRFYE